MYTEIDDIRRRRGVYYDAYNNRGWIDIPDNTLGWNLSRGLFIGFTSSLVSETFAFYFKQYSLIRKRFDPPESVHQLYLYFKTAHSLPNASFQLKNRAQFAFLSGIDWMVRIFGFKKLVGGIGQVHGSFDFEFGKRVYPTMLAAFLTCWTYSPVLAAKAAFKGDQSFPPELRRGYRSIWHAFTSLLLKNPLMLWRNSLHIMLCSFIQTSFLFSIYNFNIELWSPVFNDEVGGSLLLTRMFCAGMATFFASAGSFPVNVTLQNVIELYPKQVSEGLFFGSYKKAWLHFWTNDLWSQAWAGYFRSGYFFKTFPGMFALLWLFDNFGFMKSARVDYRTLPGNNTFGTFFY